MSALLGFSLTNMLPWDYPAYKKLDCIKSFYETRTISLFREIITDFNLNEDTEDYRTYLCVEDLSFYINSDPNLEEVEGYKSEKVGVIKKYPNNNIPDFFSHWNKVPLSISYDAWIGLSSVNIFIPGSKVYRKEKINLRHFDAPILVDDMDNGITILQSLKKEAKSGDKKEYDELIKLFKVAKKNYFLICISL